MIDGSGAEFSVELFCSKSAQLLDVAWPQVENVVPRVSVSLLHDDHLRPKQLGLYGSPQPARSSTDNHDPRPLARLPSVVALLSTPLVQLGPQGLSLPGLQLGFQLWVKVRKLIRFQP